MSSSPKKPRLSSIATTTKCDVKDEHSEENRPSLQSAALLQQNNDRVGIVMPIFGGLTEEEKDCVVSVIMSLSLNPHKWQNSRVMPWQAPDGTVKRKCFFKLTHVWAKLPEHIRRRYKKSHSGGTIDFFEKVKMHPETFVTSEVQNPFGIPGEEKHFHRCLHYKKIIDQFPAEDDCVDEISAIIREARPSTLKMHQMNIYPKTSHSLRNRLVSEEGVLELALMHRDIFVGQAKRKKNDYGNITLIQSKMSKARQMAKVKEEYKKEEDFNHAKGEPKAELKEADKKGVVAVDSHIWLDVVHSSAPFLSASAQTTYHLAIRDALNSVPPRRMTKSLLYEWLLANQFFVLRKTPKSETVQKELDAYLPLIKCFVQEGGGNWTYSNDLCSKCEKS